MTPDQAGTAALAAAVSDILRVLLSADTARHGGDGPAYGEPVAHTHHVIGWETYARLQGVADRVDGLLTSLGQPEPAGIEAAARKYAGLPATTGELGANYDHAPSGAQLPATRCQSAQFLGHKAECSGTVDLYYTGHGTRTEWLCGAHAGILTRVPA